MKAGMMYRMSMAMTLVFGLFFSLVIALLYASGISDIVAMLLAFIFTIFIVLLQWALGPIIIKFFYKIEWYDYEDIPPHLRNLIKRVCEENNINEPMFGIIPDNNPNAFTFGWTKNSAHVVLTRGIFEYCDKDEQEAVLAHELGHVVHNDYVVMTIVYMIPLLFYILFRFSLRIIARRSRGKGAASSKIIFVIVAVVSYLMYIFGHLISQLISRYREYWADRFSAEVTGKPNALSMALVKIAYGLAIEGKGDDKTKYAHAKYQNPLMIFDARAARGIAANSTIMSPDGDEAFSISSIKKAMTWDLWNIWAFFYEIQMSHPLPAKRIITLATIAKDELGQKPAIDFDYKKEESFVDEFLIDIFSKYSYLIILFPIILLIIRGVYITAAEVASLLFLSIGVSTMLYYLFYHYPGEFKNEKVSNLIINPKASPIRGIPVVLKGKIIGRGRPGLFYAQDLKLNDGSGLIFLNYNQISPIINLFIGLFRTEELIDGETVVRGWYRRAVIPYVDVYTMEFSDKNKKVFTMALKKAFAGLFIFFGLFAFVASESKLLVLSFLIPMLLMLGTFYTFVRWKYADEHLESLNFTRGEQYSKQYMDRYHYLDTARKHTWRLAGAIAAFISVMLILTLVFEPMIKPVIDDGDDNDDIFRLITGRESKQGNLNKGNKISHSFTMPENLHEATFRLTWTKSGLLKNPEFIMAVKTDNAEDMQKSSDSGSIIITYQGLNVTDTSKWDVTIELKDAPIISNRRGVDFKLEVEYKYMAKIQ